MTPKEGENALNSCDYIYLISHEEAPEEHNLRLVVHEARVEKEPSQIKTGNAKLDQVMGVGFAIKSGPSCREFTITFENYVGFSIKDESYAVPEGKEDYARKLRSYSKSAFLNFIEASTFAADVMAQPIHHFAIVCENHVIDVACAKLPAIQFTSIADSVGNSKTK